MKTAEQLATDYLLERNLDNTTFHLESAVLLGIEANGQFVPLANDPDIYDLLGGAYELTNYVGIAVHTTGWASPLNENGKVDCPPSQDPKRRRVALVASVTDDGMGSAMAFQDDPTDIVTDDGQATGALADALRFTWVTNKAEVWG